jgi:glycosyltransferase involved in cell wall biosynthesis
MQLRLAMIVRADTSGGLGAQTYALCRLLRPWKIMIIDSTPFNANPQHIEAYSEFPNQTIIRGFPSNLQCAGFLSGAQALWTCEIPYNYHMFAVCRRNNIKAYLMYNAEFLDYWREALPEPYRFVAPSPWLLEEVRAKFPETVYLPPPTFSTDFNQARATNFKRTGRRRFLHIVGNPAVNDRAGTQLLLNALRRVRSDFELVIRTQRNLVGYTGLDDPRVLLRVQEVDRQQDLYSDFDAVIHPRRYGGLNLIMNEALMSGLPVVMGRCSPNDLMLPSDWLVDGQTNGRFMTRRMIDLFDMDEAKLADKIEWLATMSDRELAAQKGRAFEVGYNEFSETKLKPKYNELLEGSPNYASSY